MPYTQISKHLKPAHTALLIALLPLICINLNYLIAAYLDHVPWCLPYLQGCQTISATSEYPLENSIYLSMMLPTCILMMIYWKQTVSWNQAQDGQIRAIDHWILICGILASLGLLVSTAFLHTQGEIHFLHRIGTGVFFLMNYIAQLLTTLRTQALQRRWPQRIDKNIRRRKLALTSVQTGVAVFSGLLSISELNTFESNNIIEWNFTLLVLAYYFSSYLDWRTTAPARVLAGDNIKH